MSEGKIGSYKIEQNPEGTVVKYDYSTKDILDIFIVLFTGLCCSLITHTIFRQVKKDPNWIVIILLAFFLLFTVYKLLDGFIRVLSLGKNKIFIDKTNRVIRVRNSTFSFVKIDFRDVAKVQLKGTIEQLATINSLPVARIYCSVDVVDKRGDTITILIVNTRKLIKSSEREIQQEVYLTGKKIAAHIAAEINTKYQWIGFL